MSRVVRVRKARKGPKPKVELVPWPANQNRAGKRRIKAAKAVNRGTKRRNRPRPNRSGGGGASGMGSTRTGQRTRKSCTVVEDEFISAVTVGNQPNFNAVAYPINPGQSQTFPWLAKEAAQWEKYTFEMLEFYYKREVSEFATAGQQGKVIMSVDYDASDAPPSSKQQMEDTDPHVDNMPCENNRLRLNRRDMHGLVNLPKYVRIGGLPGSTDIKTYDVGNLFVATQGIPSNTEVGELRVRYRVKFEIPVLESVTTAPANNQVGLYRGINVNTSGVTTVQPMAVTVQNGIGAVDTAGQFVFPAGNYNIDVNADVTSTTLSQCTLDIFKNGVSYDGAAWSSNFQATGGTVVTANLNKSTFIQSNGTDLYSVVVFASGTTPNVAAQLRITAI